MMNGQELERVLNSEEVKALQHLASRISSLKTRIEDNKEDGCHPYEGAERLLEEFDEAVQAVDFKKLNEMLNQD